MKKLFMSFKYAFHGICLAFRTERNLRIHLIAMCYVTGFMGYFDLSRTDIALLFLLFGAVISSEMVNTAIEHFVDMKIEGFDIRAKKAKDTAAGAVLVFAIAAVVIGACLLWKPECIVGIGRDMLDNPWKIAAILVSLVVSYIICFVVRYDKK